MHHPMLLSSPLHRRGRTGSRARLPRALIASLLLCALAGCTSGDDTAGGDAAASPAHASPGEAGSHSTPPGASGSDGPSDGPSDAPVRAPLTGRTIAVDPGHNGANGKNPAIITATVPDGRGGTKACNTVGTSSDDGYPEHRFTWELSQAVETALTQAGAEVVLSRDSDDGAGPCVDERGTFADDADALISLHGNGTENRAAHGFHVITAPAGGRADEGTARTAEELGSALADALEEAGFERNPAYGDLVVRSDLATLNNASVPAVMLEAGEMRNAEDARVLASAEGQERIAEALVIALASVLADDAP